MRATGRRAEPYSTVVAVKDSPSGGSKRFPSGGSERFFSTGRGAESHSTALSSPYMYLIFWSVRGKSLGVITQKHKQLSYILVNFILRIFLMFLQAAEARSTWLCCVGVLRPAFLHVGTNYLVNLPQSFDWRFTSSHCRPHTTQKYFMRSFPAGVTHACLYARITSLFLWYAREERRERSASLPPGVHKRFPREATPRFGVSIVFRNRSPVRGRHVKVL